MANPVIKKLTPEQVAQMPGWVKKWIAIGHCTDPADFVATEGAILKAYKLIGIEEEPAIVRMGSPFSAAMAGVLGWQLLKSGGPGFPVGTDPAVLEKQLFAAASTRTTLSKTHYDIAIKTWVQLHGRLNNKTTKKARAWDADMLLTEIEEQTKRAWTKANLRDAKFNLYHGSFWAGWGAFISFLRDVVGWQDPSLERFAIGEVFIKSCGWIWWHENIAVISDRPRVINLDAEGRLHSETGPSIAYRDGWSLWHVHGVNVPQYVIEKPLDITREIIDNEANAEVRRVMIERFRLGEEVFGAAAYVRSGGGKRLDHDERFGTLWRREVPNDEAICMLEVVNSTREPTGEFKRYWLRVPPDMTTAHQASAWTFGKTPEEYAPQIET
jgi:hypothetical protein